MPQLGSPTLSYIFTDTMFFPVFRYSPLFFSYCDFLKRSLSAVRPVETSHQGPKRLLLNQDMILTSCVWTGKISKSGFEGDQKESLHVILVLQASQQDPRIPVTATEFRISDTPRERGDHKMPNQSALLLHGKAYLLRSGLASPESLSDGI